MKAMNLGALGWGVLGLGLALALGACDGGSSEPSAPGGSGGNGGSGGGSSSGTVLDDMEDGDSSIPEEGGRVGAWYVYNDATGSQDPPESADFAMSQLSEPRGDSTFAAHSSGDGFTEWGAGFGFDLNNDGTTRGTYDASAYSGVSFWARSGAGSLAIRVGLSDAQTSAEGGQCDPNTEDSCDDAFGANLQLTSEWQQFTLSFAELQQDGWGMQFPGIQRDQLYSMQFEVGTNVAFDVWVDDIMLVP